MQNKELNPQDTSNPDKLLIEYDKEFKIYSAFTSKVVALIQEILEDKKITIHSITSRVKERNSFIKKISRENRYSQLSDITDLAGIRITTYFDKDVDEVSKIIEDEFSIDVENSIDKRMLLDPDRFGYLSMHHVISLSPKRCEFTEYKRFLNFKAEIQTRSILQHAWAEMEHDLGYKSSHGIPREIRRSFSRLASLLELADKEFSNIREELVKYKHMVPDKIEEDSTSVLIDKESLRIFIEKSLTVSILDSEISALTDKSKPIEIDAPDYLIRKLEFMGITNIGTLENLLQSNRDNIINFSKLWFIPVSVVHLYPGVCIQYLCYSLLCKNNDNNIDFFVDTYVAALNKGNLKKRLHAVRSEMLKG